MAIAFRAKAQGDMQGVDSKVVAKPAGTAAADLLIAQIWTEWGGGGPDVTLPSGWTALRTDTEGADQQHQIAYKVAGASEPANYTFGFSGIVEGGIGIAAYSGVDRTTPVSAHGGQAYTGTATPSTPSVAVATGEMMVAMFAGYEDASWTRPTGMTERWDFGYSQTPPTDWYAQTLADELATSSGNVSKQATCSGSNRDVAALVALAFLKPPSGARQTFHRDRLRRVVLARR